MKKLMLSFLTALLATFGMLLAIAERPIDPTEVVVKLYSLDLEVETPQSLYCTGFHVGDGLFVTAAHCAKSVVGIVQGENKILLLHELVVDEDRDIAIFRGPVLPQKLNISARSLSWSEEVVLMGYPGWFGGFLAEPTRIVFFARGTTKSIFLAQSVGAPGCSGGPVVDKDLNVLGVFSGFIVNEVDYPTSDGGVDQHNSDYISVGFSDGILENLELAKAVMAIEASLD